MEFSQIKTGLYLTEISDETIESIAKIRMFDEKELDIRLYELHKALLRCAKEKNKHKEIGILWNLDTDETILILGEENGICVGKDERALQMIKYAPVNSLVFLHNHPRNGMFSSKDINTFLDRASLYAMTAVCNDGTIYMMCKDENFSPVLVAEEYNQHKNEGQYSGIKHIARIAKSLGLVYRCSMKRRRLHG